jgi:hypothetical protein
MDPDGSVQQVHWAHRQPGQGWTWLPPATTFPFTLTATNVPPGTDEVKAEAVDSAGLWGLSESVTVVVVPPPSGPGVLLSGHILYPDQSRTSPNGLHLLVYHQSTGNLVFYQNGAAAISTGATGPAGGVYMNPDGALEVYTAAQQLQSTSGTASAANAGAHFRVSDTGHIAIVRPNGTVAWQWP